jgi:hypothetical protein
MNETMNVLLIGHFSFKQLLHGGKFSLKQSGRGRDFGLEAGVLCVR